MFTIMKKGGGNRYTFISIALILVIIYVFKMTSPQKEADYPDIIQYDGRKYVYAETVKGSPLMFTKKKPASEEGYMILALKDDKTLDEVYIYVGFRKYRKYEVLKE